MFFFLLVEVFFFLLAIHIHEHEHEHLSGSFVFFLQVEVLFFLLPYRHTGTLIWPFCFFPTSRSFVFPTTVYTYRNIDLAVLFSHRTKSEKEEVLLR